MKTTVTKAAQQAGGIVVAMTIVSLFAVPTAAVADDAMSPSLAPGTRVRILAPDAFPGKLVGTIKSVNDQSVTLDVPDRAAPVSVLREKIVRMDVSAGLRSRGVDALIGCGIGAVVGLAIGSTQHGAYTSKGTVDAVGVVVGSGIGALIGVATPQPERWIPTAAFRSRVTLAPRIDHGVGLTVAVGF
jgi:hypothetical protein